MSCSSRGGAIEPTERGFLGALATALGGGPLATNEQTTRRLAGHSGRLLLVVDTLERLRLLDDWLRQSLVPALPDSARLLIAGRDPLSPAWASALGDLLSSMALRNLAPADARELLRLADVAERDVDRLNRLAHGDPLSLRLAASAMAARPELSLDEVAVPAVVGELTRLYLDGLDPATRRTLDAAAVVRRPTRSLLAAMLDADGEEAWRRLDALPFTETGPDGLVLHDTVRDAVDAALRAADPQRRRRLRMAACAQLQTEVREATPAELWRYTSDLLFLADNPLIREGFFPTGGPSYSIEAAAQADRPAVIEIAQRYEGAAAAAIVDAWWQAAPQGVRVARPHRRRRRLPAPVRLSGGRLERDRPRPRRVTLGARTCAGGRCRPTSVCCFCATCSPAREPRSPAQPRRRSGSTPSACTWSCARACVASTSRSSGSTCWPMLTPLGFAELPGPGGAAYHVMARDFGPSSVDGWLARLVAAELAMAARPRLDPGRRELALDGRTVALTQLEYDLLSHLHDRSGQAVPRAELLTEVWGHQWEGGGNVIEVAVSALRRKLGDDAALVETVRGVGYRWREP